MTHFFLGILPSENQSVFLFLATGYVEKRLQISPGNEFQQAFLAVHDLEIQQAAVT